ncbi:MAG: CRISPR-associated endonuclease Cas1 [bacterium]
MPGGSIPKIHPEYVLPPKKIYHPQQLALFTSNPDPARMPVAMYKNPEGGQELLIDKGLSIVKDENLSQLFISGSGVYLDQKGERMIVRKDKKIVYEFPLNHLHEVIISSEGVTLASDLIAELCHRGIRLSFLNYSGKPYAMITSPLLTTANMNRREQILAFEDTRGVEFIKAVAVCKLHNQEKLLLFFHKESGQRDKGRAEKIRQLGRSLQILQEKAKRIQGKRIHEVRSLFLTIEKSSGRIYGEGVKEILNQKFELFGRIHQGATEVVDSMLNYGYEILYSQIWGALLNAGLEPFTGFMHIDQPGRSSLILDLIDEFRQPVVDRTIIDSVSLGVLHRVQGGFLDIKTRDSINHMIFQRLESSERCGGKKYQIKSIIQMQARHLAAFLRREKKYVPFRFKW